MKDRDQLFALLRNALWGEAVDVPDDTATAVRVLKEAEKQAVTALVFEAANGCGVKLPTEEVLNYVSYTQYVVCGNQQLDAAAKALDRLLSKSGVGYAIVKGQVIATCYPIPSLRQSGDVDFYCDKENFAKAKDLIHNRWYVEFDKTDSDHHLHFGYKGVTFELHYALASFYDKRRTAYWDQLLAQDPGGEVLIGGQSIRTLSPTLHVLYIFLHLYNHLLELGIGLRQFCDLAIMLHTGNTCIDPVALKKHLNALGMERAFCACGSVLVDNLGLPSELFPYRLSDKDRKYGRRILQVVFYRGNMGKYNKKGGFHGWRHNVESTCIKIAHFLKFFPLAPSFTFRWIMHQLVRKITYKMGGKK